VTAAPIWSEQPRAVALLRSIALFPPVRERRISRYVRGRDETVAYVGPRRARLDAIRREALVQATGVDPEMAVTPAEWERWFDAQDAAPEVDQVIDAVLVTVGARPVEREICA